MPWGATQAGLGALTLRIVLALLLEHYKTPHDHIVLRALACSGPLCLEKKLTAILLYFTQNGLHVSPWHP